MFLPFCRNARLLGVFDSVGVDRVFRAGRKLAGVDFAPEHDLMSLVLGLPMDQKVFVTREDELVIAEGAGPQG